MSPVDQRAFRDALGWFATGVTIITTRSPAGERFGFTANSFTSVSLDPPLVLFSLNRRAHCIAVFEQSPYCAVNVRAAHQAELSTRFASAVPDKWDGIAVIDGTDGCPVLAE